MTRPEPFTNVRSVSTTTLAAVGKIKRPRRATSEGRRKATPMSMARGARGGPPVTLTLTIRAGSEMWLEVANDEGRFFVPYDCSVFELVRQVQRGGHWLAPTPSATLRARRGIAGRD